MKVVIFSNIPAPYFVEYLNELGKYVQVTAIFERRVASDRDKTWENINNRNFEYEFLNGLNYGTESSFSLKILSIIRKHKNDCLIFANPMTPTGITGIIYCNMHNIKYLLQSEGGLAKNGKGIKENIKKYIITNADLCFSGMHSKNDYFIAYGAQPEKVKRYPFASFHESDIPKVVPSIEQKENAKKSLSIEYKKVLIYVGRMLHVKGVDVLLRALEGIDNVGVYLIGGTETDEYKEIRESKGLKNIHYVEHSNLEKLKKYYTAADLLVLPSRSDTWGLVVNEAMSFGLPVITTRNCVAGLELIEENVNGFLFESEDYQKLNEIIKKTIYNYDLMHEIGKNNLNKIKNYTYENMAEIIGKQLQHRIDV